MNVNVAMNTIPATRAWRAWSSSGVGEVVRWIGRLTLGRCWRRIVRQQAGLLPEVVPRVLSVLGGDRDGDLGSGAEDVARACRLHRDPVAGNFQGHADQVGVALRGRFIDDRPLGLLIGRHGFQSASKLLDQGEL